MTSPRPAPAPYHLMPVPASVRGADGALELGDAVGYRLSADDDRLEAALIRVLGPITTPSGHRLASVADPAAATLRVHCPERSEACDAVVPSLRDDESYHLEIDPARGVDLAAPHPTGVLRGLATLAQLARRRPGGKVEIRAASIDDRPRFAWRGLMIDVSRHFIPVPVLERNLDAMAALKFNVFHWHLTDDHGFRLESKVFPDLHRSGSDGSYYRQDEIRAVVRYAAARGIRVVPEFDLPGHTSSWLVGYPQLALVDRAYRLPTQWGPQDACVDPASALVSGFLERLFTELVPLFPDRFVHVGGDEAGGLARDLQLQFTRRLHRIFAGLGKRLIGWDEIAHPELPRDVVVQSWRGPESIRANCGLGFDCLRSHGYYLDHLHAAGDHYRVDPTSGLDAQVPGAPLPVLGGEACMWTEYTDADHLDSRIWPRAAAIAERLWSSADVRDEADMYRRLDVVSVALAELGLAHESVYRDQLEQLSGGDGIEPLQLLTDLLAPQPHRDGKAPRHTDRNTRLDSLVDAIPPESRAARRFAAAVRLLLDGGEHAAAARDEVETTLRSWAANHDRLPPTFGGTAVGGALLELSMALHELAKVGLSLLRCVVDGSPPPTEWLARARAGLHRATRPHADLMLQVVAPMRQLVRRAAGGAADRQAAP